MRFSKDECIESIIALAEENPIRVITRNFFRANGGIPDKDWEFHFGSFTEFKRAAGLDDSTRKSKKIQTIRTKEASVDKLRAENNVRWSWDEQYKSKEEGRFLTFVVASDVHDEMCDPFFRRMFIQAILNRQADKVIYNGDLIDNAEISNYKKRLSDYNPVRRMNWVHEFISDCRDAAKTSAEFILVEGNHEYRLISHLTEHSPYVMDMLDAKGMNARQFFGLDQFHVNYYSRADFGTFTEKDIQNELKRNYYKFRSDAGSHVLFHHFPQGKDFGMPGCNGHHHKFHALSMKNETYGPYNWYQTGGGTRRHVDYLVNMGEFWQNGFMIVTVDKKNVKNTVFEYVDCTNEICNLDGTIHLRNEDEKVYLTH